MSELNAAQPMELINLRKRRADQIVAMLMTTLSPVVDRIERGESRHPRSDVWGTLHEAFFESGAELLTDALRTEIGLPPRGPHGWTAEEIFELERRRLEVLKRPIGFTIPDREE